jgi:hypothetical protein
MCGCCNKTKAIQLSDDRDENNVPIPMEEIDPPPTMHSTAEQPIIPKDNRDIIWELQRRILEELPEVDDASEDAAFHLRANIGLALETVVVPTEISEWIDALEFAALRLLYDFISSSLPDANGNVVAFNPVLTACCASNTAAYPLGNTTQANSSCFYLSPYLGKQKAAIDVILSTFEKSLEDIEKRPSIHADSGSDSRSVTHLFQRMLNSLSRKIEICDTQAVAALLGMGPVVCTDNFSYFGPNEAANFALANQLQDTKTKPRDDSDSMEIDEEEDSEGDSNFISEYTEEEQRQRNSVQQEMEQVLVQLGPTDQRGTLVDGASRKRSYSNVNEIADDDDDNDDNDHLSDDNDDDDYLADLMESDAVDTWNLGKTAVYKIDNDTNSIPIHYNTHHRYRGIELRDLTRVDYETTIRVQKKTTTKASGKPMAATGSRPGHVRNKRFEFGKGHVLAASHEQVIRTKQCVLIFTGRQPPIPSNESTVKARNKFAGYILAAFRAERDLYKEGQINELHYDWSALCEYLLHLETSDLVISKMRLAQIWKCIFNMMSSHASKVKLSDFRSRARKIWSQEELVCAASTYSASQHESQKRARDGDETTDASGKATAPLTMASFRNQNTFLNDCKNSRGLFDAIIAAARPSIVPRQPKVKP